MDRSTALNVLLFLVALSLFLGPIAAPPEEPTNRVEYRVESFEDPVWEPLEYEALAPTEREVFDAARADPSGTHTVTPDASPERLTPSPGSIDTYSVYAGSESYLLEVTHHREDVDVGTQIVPRLGALASGVLLGTIAAYRQFV